MISKSDLLLHERVKALETEATMFKFWVKVLIGAGALGSGPNIIMALIKGFSQ